MITMNANNEVILTDTTPRSPRTISYAQINNRLKTEHPDYSDRKIHQMTMFLMK